MNPTSRFAFVCKKGVVKQTKKTKLITLKLPAYLCLSCRCLDEVSTRHHAHSAGLVHLSVSSQLASLDDRLHVRVAAGLAEGLHLVIELLPLTAQSESARDDDVDFSGTVCDSLLDLGELVFRADLAGGEPGRDRGNGDTGANTHDVIGHENGDPRRTLQGT